MKTWEDYIASVLKRIEQKPIPYDNEADVPAMTGINPERDAIRTLIARGLVELDYRDNDGRMHAKIKSSEPPVPTPSNLPYDESPALLALRERRRTLGY